MESLALMVAGEKRALGVEHADELTSVNNLAFTIKRQGRNIEAVQLMAECV